MAKGSIYVIDAHALIWHLEDSRKLSASARAALDEIERGDGLGIVPSIVLAEIVHLSDKHTISIPIEQVITRLQKASNFRIFPLDLRIVLLMVPFKDFELHDRVIMATSKYLKAPLITKDQQIRRSGIRCIW